MRKGDVIVRCVFWVLIFILIGCAILLRTPTAEAEDGLQTTAIPSPTFRVKDVEKEVWSILREEFSETATAAIMGNLWYESGGYPFRYEGLTVEESYELNEKWKHDEKKFISSNRGYGLAGWTGTTNLTRFWNWSKENGYEVDSVEGQIRFLMEDYPLLAEMSYKRMALYQLEDIVSATEDFRQSYEKSIWSEYSQYKRAKLAKQIYAGRCEDIYTIQTASEVPYNFDITEKVKALNKEILENVD